LLTRQDLLGLALLDALELHLGPERLRRRLGELWAGEHLGAGEGDHLPANVVGEAVLALRGEDLGEEEGDVAERDLRGRSASVIDKSY
jgi:hypothetical protein